MLLTTWLLKVQLLKAWVIVVLGSLLTSNSVSGQTSTLNSIDVTFNHKYPGRQQQQLATDFMWEDYGEAARAAGAGASLHQCRFAIGSIRFRLHEKGKIDQVAVQGDSLPTYLPAFFTKRVLDSQPFWTCADCAEKGPVSVTIPVFVHHSAGCQGRRDPSYLAGQTLIYDLYRGSTELPIGGVQTGQRTLWLTPIELFTIN
jgi:hypothetical protein